MNSAKTPTGKASKGAVGIENYRGKREAESHHLLSGG